MCAQSGGYSYDQKHDVEVIRDLTGLLKDTDALNSARDLDAVANMPRNLRQFRLGWLPSYNRFRNKYERDVQITVISIDMDGLPIHGGLDPFEKLSSLTLPCLITMSPNGDLFAIANLGGEVDLRRSVTGEEFGEILYCEHQYSHAFRFRVSWRIRQRSYT